MAHQPPSSLRTPELLYLLHGDPQDLATALADARAADVAEALRGLPPDAGAKVLAALPFDLAVAVLDEPELTYERVEIVRRMGEGEAAALIEAMSADQQADLFREMPERDRPRFLSSVEAGTRRAM
jgi:Mg/Co/Ni transporter MgtE